MDRGRLHRSPIHSRNDRIPALIYLYVKTHNKTGLKYLGKTIKENFHEYKGSGKRWLNHLKIHGNDYNTSILLVSCDKEEIKQTGLFFSKLFNIVKSSEWANLREESGDGGDNSQFLDYKRNSLKASKTLQSKEWKDRNRERISEEISKSVSKTKQRKEWKETTGLKVSEEAKRRQNSTDWYETGGGKILKEKAKLRWADETFRENVSNKISEVQNSEEWKDRNYKECKCCGRKISPGNYKKHEISCFRKAENV